MRSSSLIIAALGLMFLSIPSLSFSSETELPAAARQHLENAMGFIRKHDCERAVKELEASVAVAPSYVAIKSLGTCYLELQYYTEAHAQLSRLIALYSDEMSADTRADITRRLDALDRLGRVAVAATPDGATVYVDGRRVGETPLASPLRLDAGAHILHLVKDGFAPYSETVIVADRTTTRIAPILHALDALENDTPAEAPPRPVRSTRQAPAVTTSVPKPIDPSPMTDDLPGPRRKGVLIGATALAISGMAGLAVGGYFTGKGVNDKHALEEARWGSKDRFDTLYNDTLPMDQAMTLTGFIVGGTLLTAGAIFFLIDRLQHRARAQHRTRDSFARRPAPP